MPEVSVIIPTYNRERYVVKAIDSVLRQTFKDYEIIVVDDGSTDNTKEVLKRYGDRINYIYQDNAGVSAARNTGINHARGEWLAFLDSDDEWKAEYLHKQMESARHHPGISMQTADCLFIGLKGETRRYFEINRSLAAFNGKDYLFLDEPFSFVVKHGPWPMPATIVRRETITKVGLFDTNLSLSEDFEFMARVALRGPFGMIRESLVSAYRRNESVVCLTNQVRENPMQTRESAERIFEKLRQIPTLKYKERKALDGIVSANKRAMGNLLLMEGKAREAREFFRRAVGTDLSIASLGKYFLSFLPAETNLWIVEKNAALKAREKKYCADK
jgi:glycosyltransferase involved in cell wall biosynthesis